MSEKALKKQCYEENKIVNSMLCTYLPIYFLVEHKIFTVGCLLRKYLWMKKYVLDYDVLCNNRSNKHTRKKEIGNIVFEIEQITESVYYVQVICNLI